MTQQEIKEATTYFDSIKESNNIWIEAEMPHSAKRGFDSRYETVTGESVPDDSSTYPYYVWAEGANKWGVELRVYFNPDDSIPSFLSELMTDNSRSGYEQYDNRINNNDLIWALFENGFVLGDN
jgi:hypothetical protein